MSVGDSSNGRTADSDSVSIGSNPISPARFNARMAHSYSEVGHSSLATTQVHLSVTADHLEDAIGLLK